MALINNHKLNNSGIDEASGNTMLPSGAVYSITAKLGSHSLFFDGIDDLATQQNPTNLIETLPFSTALWFKPNVTQESFGNIAGVRLDSLGVQGNGAMTVRYNGLAANLQFLVRNTVLTVQQVLTVNNYKDDIWHFLIFGRDNSNRLRINIDGGAEDITGPVLSGSWWDPGDYLRIGAYLATQERFKGYIDNVLTYDSWLTPAEIATLWNNGDGIEISGLKSFRKLGRGLNTGLGRGLT